MGPAYEAKLLWMSNRENTHTEFRNKRWISVRRRQAGATVELKLQVVKIRGSGELFGNIFECCGDVAAIFG